MSIDSPVFRTCALGLALLGLSACDTPPTQVDEYFGLSVQQAQVQQTLNLSIEACPMQSSHPECPGARDGGRPQHWHMQHRAARDSDGESAHAAIQRYQESFASPMNAMPGTSAGNGSALKR